MIKCNGSHQIVGEKIDNLFTLTTENMKSSFRLCNLIAFHSVCPVAQLLGEKVAVSCLSI